MKIIIKTLVLLLTLILIAGTATIMVSQTISANIVEQVICDYLVTTAQLRANHIETILNDDKQNIELMATGDHFRNIVDPSKDYNQSIEQVNRRINTILQTNEDISRVRVLDKNGIVIASSHPEVGYDKSATEIFLKGKEGVYIRDLHTSEFTGNEVISVAAPILVNGEFSGVIVVNFDAEKELFEITTDRAGLGETGEIYLVNKDDYMISPARFANDTFLKLKVDTGHSGAELEAIKHWGTYMQEHEVVSGKNYLDRAVIRTHAHIVDMGWVLVVDLSEEEAFAPVAMLTRAMLLILTILLVLGTIFAIPVSRAITKPMVKLYHGVEEIGKGNLDFKVGTKTSDEIGQLSRAFDSMTAKLKESRAEMEEYSSGLEGKVEERTKELDEKVKESEEQVMATQNLLDDVNETKNKLEESRHAMLNMVYDLEMEKREVESAKNALEVTNIKLERSNKELPDFTYIASHDLREPLRKISAFGQLLQESLKGKLDEDEEENFAFMIDGATRMQQMVNDLLVYSRVTTKAKPPERVDLNAVIEDLKNVELAVQVEETGGVINVPEPLPHVQVDPSQIHQLLQNLIGNGLKYSRKGVAPVITVRSRQEDGKKVRIEVQDNGIGIEEEYQANIFGMFKRLYSHEEYEGSGIGLAVCKKIVERHGGEIGVVSNPGEGSTFWFTVPITLPVTSAEVEIERNRWDIMFDILRGISVTEGVQKPKFDLASDKRYFKFLWDNGFLEACGEPGEEECYKLTEEGQDLLWKLQEVAAMVQGWGRG
jgi:signal transduction histidine kinase/predicted transcriptional regulator